VLDQPHPSVLAHSCTWDDGCLVAVHNLGPEPRSVPLQLDEDPATARLVDLLGQEDAELDDKGRVELQLEGYDYRWLRVVREGDRRLT
jgi:hypothetical protein